MKLELRYFSMPLTNIPFHKIKGLNGLSYKNIVCSEYYVPLNEKMCFTTAYDYLLYYIEYYQIPSKKDILTDILKQLILEKPEILLEDNEKLAIKIIFDS